MASALVLPVKSGEEKFVTVFKGSVITGETSTKHCFQETSSADEKSVCLTQGTSEISTPIR